MEITDAKYQELLGDQQKARALETENSKLKDTAENTKTALKANRDEIASLKADKESVQTEFDTFKTEKEEELKKLENFEELESNSKKWTDHETALAEKRTANIEEMKTKLGEDFMKTNESFLDGLPEDKVETFLNGHVEALDGGKQNVTTGINNGWMNPWTWANHKTEFDEAITKWDHMAALNAIPAPGSE